MSKKRFLSLWFPYLEVEISLKNHPELIKMPFSIVSMKNQNKLLSSLNEVAEYSGLKVGMNIHEAHAICPSLITKDKDIQKEYNFIKFLANWSIKFTPLVAIEKPDSLMLDISGCAHLFNGEKKLIDNITIDLNHMGISVFSGLADNPILARALARFGINEQLEYTHKQTNTPGSLVNHETRATRSKFIKRYQDNSQYYSHLRKKSNLDIVKQIAQPGMVSQILDKMPIESLYLNDTEIDEIKDIGILKIGDISNIPYKILRRRFGPKIVTQLKKALGKEPEIIPTFTPEVKFSYLLKLEEPIDSVSDILKVFERLVKLLCERLKSKNQGTKEIYVVLNKIDNTRKIIKIETAKLTSQKETFTQLFKIKIQKIKTEFGIGSIQILTTKASILLPFQHSLDIIVEKKTKLFLTSQEEDSIKNLISRLGTKLGFKAITYLQPEESHIPEKNYQSISANCYPPNIIWPCPKYPRPALLFKPEPIKIIKTVRTEKMPKLFVWKYREYNLINHFGPERIAPEWWLDNPDWRSGIRDYWRVESICGTKLWLFETKNTKSKNNWFIHGSFV